MATINREARLFEKTIDQVKLKALKEQRTKLKIQIKELEHNIREAREGIKGNRINGNRYINLEIDKTKLKGGIFK